MVQQLFLFPKMEYTTNHTWFVKIFPIKRSMFGNPRCLKQTQCTPTPLSWCSSNTFKLWHDGPGAWVVSKSRSLCEGAGQYFARNSFLGAPVTKCSGSTCFKMLQVAHRFFKGLITGKKHQTTVGSTVGAGEHRNGTPQKLPPSLSLILPVFTSCLMPHQSNRHRESAHSFDSCDPCQNLLNISSKKYLNPLTLDIL